MGILLYNAFQQISSIGRSDMIRGSWGIYWPTSPYFDVHILGYTRSISKWQDLVRVDVSDEISSVEK